MSSEIPYHKNSPQALELFSPGFDSSPDVHELHKPAVASDLSSQSWRCLLLFRINLKLIGTSDSGSLSMARVPRERELPSSHVEKWFYTVPCTDEFRHLFSECVLPKKIGAQPYTEKFSRAVR